MESGVTESQRVLAQAGESHTVVDKNGRVIEIKRPSRRELMKHMRTWGSACNVEAWFALAILSASVRSIDGRVVPAPNTVDQVEMIAELLGEDGTTAVGDWYQAQQETATEEYRNIAKN